MLARGYWRARVIAVMIAPMGTPSRRRVAGIALTAIAGAALAAALIAPWSGGRGARPDGLRARAPSSSAGARARHSASPPNRAQSTEESPGALPQTHALPSASGPRFGQLMAALWRGIAWDSVSHALPAFFPRAAYVRLKAIGSAGADWRDRLVHEYRLDIAAAHALLGSGAGSAQLLGVTVPSSHAHWVPPGACYNAIGYYEVPNARVVYREGGAERSFGIASLISWRGVWYVVHLGSVLRPSEDAGTVDEPTSGGGSSASSGTC
jgi:hypothetical protein